MAKYIIATGIDASGYTDRRGAYDSLELALTCADGCGQGYKVFSGNTVIYEQQVAAKKIARKNSRVLGLAKEMTTQMKGTPSWFYSNIGCSRTFSTAFEKKNYKSNCATLANWILRKLNVTGAGQTFYGRKGGTIQWGAETEAAVKTMCDVFELNKTVDQALADGSLQPGDVCCYGHQHTNIYAGGDKWYESGTVYSGGSGAEGTPIRKFYGSTALHDWIISWVIRYNDSGYKAHQRTFRVQVGAYSKKANAKAFKAVMAKDGVPCIVKKYGSQYIVQAGLFSVPANGAAMAERIIGKKLPCMIIGL